MSRYLPPLSVLISLDKLPSNLGFIESGLDTVFSQLYFRDFYSKKSYYSEEAHYNIKIVSKTRLALNLGGDDGFALVLNPSFVDGETSDFPMYITYSWPLLKYINGFDISSFDFSFSSIFYLLLDIGDIDENQLFNSVIDTFYPDYSEDGTEEPLQKFVDDFNANNNPPTPLVFNELNGQIEIIEDLILQLSSNGNDYSVFEFILNDYFLADDDFGSIGYKIERIFYSFFGQFNVDNLSHFLLPKFYASLTNLFLALEFPRTWLQPINPATLEVVEDESIKSMITYNAGSLAFSSEYGFEFNQLDSFNLTPSQIGNTGLIIEIQNLKFDFRTDKNVPEATADGRPDTFKGVYVEYAAITLPPTWFNDDEVVGGITAKVAGYNMLIGTGGVSGTVALETQTFRNTDGTILNYYQDYFEFVYPIKTTHNDAENLVVTPINNHTELKSQLETHNATQFVFPLSLTKVGETEPTIFENVSDYYSYLNILYDDSDENNRPRLSKRIGDNGFEIWFTSFDMTFQQGHIVESNIQGGLKIPKLKDSTGEIANIDIFGHIDDDGGFNVTASEQDGFRPIIIPEVLNIQVNSLEVGRESSDDPFYIGTACDITFTNEVIKKFIGDQSIKIERLRIYSDGSFEIVGGAISVPTNFTLKLGPVEVSITGINFGSFQEEHNGVMRRYNYFGFDGGISLGNIGVEARGEGVKYFYTVDNGPAVGNEGDAGYQAAKEAHSYIRIETIEVDLTIPGNATASAATAIIKGWLSINEVEYAGGVSLKLPKLKMAGGADMRLQPKPPAFLIDAYLDIPIPIPLASTGLGITGFRGIAGFRYVAEKEAVGLHSHDDKWYDYYTHPERGINVNKFNGPDKSENATNAFSIGAGVTIATMGASDVISLRVMVLLSIPSMLMIDGRASILSKEWGLDDTGEPPFFAYMILAENGIEIGAGVDFKLPQDSGEIIDLHVYMQAGYFWDNPSGWFLNMGTREDPITAKVLTLVEMESFLMLSASGIEAGARISFDIEERFGPIGVKAWLLAEVGGFISFERPQIGGFMTVDAGAKVDLFGIITVGVSFFVHFAAEAAKPFLIYAEIRVCGRIKIAFIKIKVCATVKMKWEKSREVDTKTIPAIAEALRDQAVKGINMLTGESFELINFGEEPPATTDLLDGAIIPLDTYIDIKFDKAVLPGEISEIIGSYNNPPENYEDLIPPVKVIKGNELRQVKHRYQITNISIMAANEEGNAWEPYHPYEAIINAETAPVGLDLSNLRIGHWQKSSKEYNAIRILATSPFSYAEQGEPGWFIPEQLGLTNATFFCEGEERTAQCANWLNIPLNTSYNTVNHFPYFHSHQDLFFDISQGESSNVNGIEMSSVATVVNDANTFGFSQSLQFPNSSTLEFKFPQPSVEISFKISTNAQSVEVTYYKSFLPEGGYLIEYEVVESITYSQSQLSNNNDGVTYINEEMIPISKIEIKPVLGAIQADIDGIYEQIEQLFNDTYEQLGSGTPEGANVEVPLDAANYFHLLNQLETIQHQSCVPVEGDCKKDEKICGLYDLLFEIFKRSFPEQIDSRDEIRDFISQYKLFVENIHSGLPQEFIEANLQPTLNEYSTLLEAISENPDVDRYYQMREKAEIIINKLNVLGNCDCSQNNVDCDEDDILCNYYEALNTVYTDCIQPASTINEVQSNLSCIGTIIESVKTFDTEYQHPTISAMDIEDYLAQNLTYLSNTYATLISYFEGNSDLTESQALTLYNNVAVIYTQVIVSLISQLGNCNCEDQANEPQLRCNTLLHSICWKSVEDWTYNLNIPDQAAIQLDYEAMVAGINQVVDPIWRPNTRYYIAFEVKDIVNDDESLETFKYHYGFKTAGTIGHYHNAPNVVYGNQYDTSTNEIINRDENGKLTNPDQYALTSIEQYIDYRRSYPNADGNLLQSKPLFYSQDYAKLLLFYIKPYVAHMLKDIWNGYGTEDVDGNYHLPTITNTNGLQALKVFIQDPVTNILMEHPMPPEVIVDNIPQTVEQWDVDTAPPMPLMLQYMQHFVEAQGGNCNFNPGEVIKPASQYTTVNLHNLKPRKMYTAIFTNTFEDVTKQIHNYVFQTSRYLNFDEQINSYVLEADENGIPTTQALFNVNLDLTSLIIDDVFAIVGGQNTTNDDLESQYIDYLDRVLVGVLRMPPLDPPVTTEFNVIRNQNNNEAIGLLIRNPEPFNDPKIPLEIIRGIDNSQAIEEQGTIAVALNESQRDLAYTVLYSKDYSQALIMHSSKKLTTDSLDIRFQYKLWDGNKYDIVDPPVTVNLILNPEN
ncbi:hypothetical protein HSX10_16270 [Winogradskyella undariae]|uniref:hypothetical protein n=1 Tax=Winogradskyella undariae TaxID=1285465 RepID=UPI00156B6494|nr:hypothetical protein [Winogradskyella undariae]NRR93133.1 hypothetical protein [Winogradskyella undariae]